MGEQPGKSRTTRPVLILLLLAIFPILILTAFYSSLNVAATNGPIFKFGGFGQPANNIVVTSFNDTIFGNTNNTGLFNQPNSTFFSLPPIPESFVVALVILAFLAVGIGLFRNFQRQRQLSGFDLSEEAKAKRAEVVAALDDALSQLGRGEGYRETIQI